MTATGTHRRVLQRPSFGGLAALVATAFMWASCAGEANRGNSSAASTGSTGSGATSGAVGGGAATATGSGSGGTSSAAASSGSTTTGVTATTGVVVLPDASTDGGFEDCDAEVSMAQGVGLDMYIVFDRSLSMQDGDCGGQCAGVPDGATQGDCPIDLVNPPASNSKWCLATNALARFFAAPTDLDVRVAFQFMTPGDGGGVGMGNNVVCDAVAGNPHATAAVDYSPLPVDATHPLIAALENETPEFGGTLIESALNGISMYTSANADPARKTIGVLITDGDPQFGCNDNEDDLAAIAAAHLAATDIPTFFIGMTGATSARLETMAEAGGGPEHGPEFCDAEDTCHYWTVGDGDPGAFGAVLEAITDSVVIPCEYSIPDPGAGQKLNPDLVAVSYDDASGAEPASVAKVGDESSCDAVTGGWFYDDPAAPTAIRLCQASCNVVSVAPPGAQVQIRYGCREDVQ